MNKYVIALLLAIVLALGSYAYKASHSKSLASFPIKEFAKENEGPTLFLFLFFSRRTCAPCLGFIELLNALPARYKVVGLVPKDDLSDEDWLRKMTGARFELRSSEPYKKHVPNCNPTLVGVNNKGQVLFVMPGFPNTQSYLADFLETLYNRTISHMFEQR